MESLAQGFVDLVVKVKFDINGTDVSRILYPLGFLGERIHGLINWGLGIGVLWELPFSWVVIFRWRITVYGIDSVVKSIVIGTR